MTEDSPIVNEVRERAMKISERFGHDLREYCAHLRKVEREHPDRVVSQVTVVRTADGAKPALR